jgi:plastocyanin
MTLPLSHTFFTHRALPLIAALALGAVAMQARAEDTPVVAIKEFMFMPMSTTIKAGTTVTWKNLDDEAHSVIAEDGLFHSDALDKDGTFTYKFDKPGVYKVLCGLHPFMKETITVE